MSDETETVRQFLRSPACPKCGTAGRWWWVVATVAVCRECHHEVNKVTWAILPRKKILIGEFTRKKRG